MSSIDFIPNYGINIYPIGYCPATVFTIIIGVAIIKHNLMDINIVIKKSALYSILVFVITIIYLICIVIFEKYFQNVFEYENLIGSVTASVIIAIVFTPLKNLIQDYTDKKFLKGTALEIAEQNKLLRQEITQSEKYKTLATLASGVAHEIKNPLTALKTFAEFVPKKINDKNFLLKLSIIVPKETERINEMVHQLLEYAKPTVPTMRSSNIKKLIKETIQLYHAQFIENKIKVTEDLLNDNTKLILDPNQLKQVMINIIGNALDAMPGEGILQIATVKTESHYHIIFRDSGKGIPSEELPQIFDPFFSRKDNGTGLGLAICQSIIESHNGKIKVKSQVGIGTEFILELPLPPPPDTGSQGRQDTKPR